MCVSAVSAARAQEQGGRRWVQRPIAAQGLRVKTRPLTLRARHISIALQPSALDRASASSECDQQCQCM